MNVWEKLSRCSKQLTPEPWDEDTFGKFREREKVCEGWLKQDKGVERLRHNMHIVSEWVSD